MIENAKYNQIIIRIWKPRLKLGNLFRLKNPYLTGHVSIEIKSGLSSYSFYFNFYDKPLGKRFLGTVFRAKNVFKKIFYFDEHRNLYFSCSNIEVSSQDHVEIVDEGDSSDINTIYQYVKKKSPVARDPNPNSMEPADIEFLKTKIKNPERYFLDRLYIGINTYFGHISFSHSLVQDTFAVMGGRFPDESIILLTLDKLKIEERFREAFQLMNEKPRSSFSYINLKDFMSSLWRDMMHGCRDLNVPSFKKNTFALGASIALINPAFFLVSSYGFYHLKNFLVDFRIACLGYCSILVLFFLLRGTMAEALIQQINSKRKIDLESGLKQTLLSLERDKHEIINCSKLVNDLIYYGDTRGILSQSHLRWIGFRSFDFLFFCLFMLIACAEEFYIDVVDHHDQEVNRILVRSSIYTAVLAVSFAIYFLSLFMAAFVRYCQGDGTLTYPMKVLKDAMMYLEHESMPTLLPINDSLYHSWNILSDEALYIRREAHGITFFNQYMKKHDQKNEFLTRHELGLSFPEGWSEEFANEQRFFGFKKKIVNLTYQKSHDRNEYPGLLQRDKIRRECEQEDREYLSRVKDIVGRSKQLR